MPKIMSVVNGIYKSRKPEDDKLYLHEVTEYSEIPDLQQKNEFHEYLDSPKHVTRAKFHASPSLVVHVDTCEHSFQKNDEDNKKHTNDRGLVENPGLAPLQSSDESDIQQEKECYANTGINFSKATVHVDITTKTKENKTTETHTEQLDNLNSNSTYFVLSADGNKKSMVPEFTSFTSCKNESENSKLQNTEKRGDRMQKSGRTRY
uniref:Uncharacterized protein n=1 Tax=Magallana gigas TaxID=29159 RepID=A0A8W8M0L6_MAGGI